MSSHDFWEGYSVAAKGAIVTAKDRCVTIRHPLSIVPLDLSMFADSVLDLTIVHESSYVAMLSLTTISDAATIVNCEFKVASLPQLHVERTAIDRHVVGMTLRHYDTRHMPIGGRDAHRITLSLRIQTVLPDPILALSILAQYFGVEGYRPP